MQTKATDENMKKSLFPVVTMLLGLLLPFVALAAPAVQFEGETLTLATTTSTYDSGLLDFILPDFEAQTGANVDVISVGTGQALELGRNGDADVVLVHARAREDAFVADGHAPARYDVMYNDFVIVGPASDPAGIADAASVTEALATIADAEAPFISRGDDSGTHSKERSLWTAAELTPTGDWYQETGQGMGAVLTIADEQQAYTLADRATYLALQVEGNELVVLVEGDESLFNPYGVMPVDPAKNDMINGELAQAFVDWLISVETQELIAAFAVNGTQLFTPNSDLYNAAQVDAQTVSAIFTDQSLTLATTTSTYDSGLLDFILPDFEAQTGATVEVISVGTGQALELGRNGDADVVLVHARPREDAFVADGHAPARYDVMYNDFVILGPASDPAGITDAASVTEALAAIATAEAPFISRGDDSGTHSKELSLWAAAELEPSGDWYQETGQGMGAVLTIANEQQAYTLADRATYLAAQLEGNELIVLFEGDEVLFNPYGVMPVDPSKNDAINAELATAFIDWLLSVETQELIASFEVNSTQLFTPNSEPYNAAQDAG